MNTLKTFLLMAVMTTLLVGIGGAVGGRGGASFALLAAAAMNLGSWWFSDRIVLGMYRARVVDAHEAPELVAVVEELARAAELPMPRVAIIPEQAPNAFATGRSPDVAVVAITEGLLRMLDREELAGVMAHELAHVRNRDTLISSIAATMVGAITMIARFGLWFGGSRDRGGGLAALLMLVLAPLAAVLIQMSISRSREFAADAFGARVSGHPLALARALNKLDRYANGHPSDVNPATSHMFIINPLGGSGGLGRLFRTHPTTEERVARLKEMAL
ncbi:MAG: zinc metalloprotease HtpX [Alphaproteobacteria bacterium]|nr:zinc metalloprotease HtpX [Alphaproteobacteria bacterium]